MNTVKIEDGKVILKDRANPDSNRHVEMFYENGIFKTVEVTTTRTEKLLNDINLNTENT